MRHDYGDQVTVGAGPIRTRCALTLGLRLQIRIGSFNGYHFDEDARLGLLCQPKYWHPLLEVGSRVFLLLRGKLINIDAMFNRMVLGVAVLMLVLTACRADEVLIVADEFPAMEILAHALEKGGGDRTFHCQIVRQQDLPESLAGYFAVIVYIHGKLNPGPERTFIDYAESGGRLIALHHSISSGKRKNRDWFGFLGVELPLGEVQDGGYQWREGVPLQIYSVRDHFITTNRIDWPEAITLKTGMSRSATTLEDSEVYLNHVLVGPRTQLLGLRYRHPELRRTYLQETAGWYRRTGKGWLMYFMPGHSEREFQSPVYRQMLVNALLWTPDPA